MRWFSTRIRVPMKTYKPPERDEAVAFVKAILDGDTSAAAVFADWLEEHGDKRAVLLRRRWKLWQKKIAEADKPERVLIRDWKRRVRAARARSLIDRTDEEILEMVKAHIRRSADYSFCKYVREKFHDEYLWIPIDTNSQAYLSS